MTQAVVPGVLGVVGAGTMGAGIAQVALEAGWDVRLHDAVAAATERGRGQIEAGLAKRAAKAGHSGPAAAAFVADHLDRLAVVATASASADGAGIVIEAIVEDLPAKRALFAALDRAASPDTILATNTSALPVAAIAEAATVRPGRVLGLHFFNPAPVLRLVEVVASGGSDASVVDRATAIVAAWGKTPVRSTDSPGFIVNRVNRPFTIEALRMLEAGGSDVPAIDNAMRIEGFPMGPFELMDLVGLDVNLAAATAIWEALGRPERLRPSPIQSWLVAHERLGRKSGVGFYRHDAGPVPVPEQLPGDLTAGPSTGRPMTPAEIAGRIRSAVAAEAVLAREGGVATEADIDLALRLGAAHPEGPFEWLGRRATSPETRP
jgi:3-hydroxybutyryl-CoA dehydrogenase